MIRTVGIVRNEVIRITTAVLAAGMILGCFESVAFDDDFDLGADDYMEDTGDFDDDFGDTVIIDDSVNVYGGGRGGRSRRGGGGGDAAGAAMMGFMGGMVVNELMQDKKQPAQTRQQPTQAAAPPRAAAQGVPTLEQRLEEIEDLKNRGILTESEYNAKRRAIIDAH